MFTNLHHICGHWDENGGLVAPVNNRLKHFVLNNKYTTPEKAKEKGLK